MYNRFSGVGPQGNEGATGPAAGVLKMPSVSLPFQQRGRAARTAAGLVHLHRPVRAAGAAGLAVGPGLPLPAAGEAVLPVSYGICEQRGPGCGIAGCNSSVLGAALQPFTGPPGPWTGLQVPLGTLRTSSRATVPALSC